ncbi:MAG: universal stress protein [Rhizomicrobium sp.]
MKNILVPLLGLGGDRLPLDLAHRIAAVFGGHIDGLHVRRNLTEEIAELTMGEGVLTQPVCDTLEGEIRGRAAAAKTALDALCSENGISAKAPSGSSPGVGASWVDRIGRNKDEIIIAGRRHDLIVVGRDAEPFGISTADLAGIIVGCGRPVLLAPGKLPPATGRTIAIAWKSTAEAARAVTAAMPLIARAERIVVLAAIEAGLEDAEAEAALLAEQLRRLPAEVSVRCVNPRPGKVGEALVDGAGAAGADLLVLGGYGHSRAREFILGGATRDLLEESSLPLLMMH